MIEMFDGRPVYSWVDADGQKQYTDCRQCYELRLEPLTYPETETDAA